MTTKSTNDKLRRLAAKRRWSEEEARSVVEAWRSSGKRVQTFAREHGLGPWRLRYWAPLVSVASKTDKTPGSSRTNSQVKFVPAVLTGTAPAERPAVVIRLPDGIEVELRDSEDAHNVGQLVACLRGAV